MNLLRLLLRNKPLVLLVLVVFCISSLPVLAGPSADATTGATAQQAQPPPSSGGGGGGSDDTGTIVAVVVVVALVGLLAWWWWTQRAEGLTALDTPMNRDLAEVELSESASVVLSHRLLEEFDSDIEAMDEDDLRELAAAEVGLRLEF
jgi:hypothetical protein